ncbi:hypothetical protein [Methylobacterium sp. JK268]
MVHTLEQRASLAIWPSERPGGATPGQEFQTVREAIRTAATVLKDPAAKPWIVTEDGAILRPGWIREQARILGFLD